MKIKDGLGRYKMLNNGYRLVACGVDDDGNVQGFDIADENGKVLFCLPFSDKIFGPALEIIFDGLTTENENA